MEAYGGSEEANNYSASQQIPLPFIEPEGSSLCSQEPTACPYPESYAPSPQILIPFP
jgi:hypothetical protein